MNTPEKLIIFDTTLRDGEQSPGATMGQADKLRIAKQLERMGVDVIEAGFAASSPGDFAAIQAIAQVVKNSTVCSLARANLRDIEKAGLAIQAAPRKRIHTFIATSPLHMEKKLNLQPGQVIEAAGFCDPVRLKNTRTISNSPVKMPPDLNLNFYIESLRQLLEREQTRLTFRIPSDMPFHLFSENLSRI